MKRLIPTLLAFLSLFVFLIPSSYANSIDMNIFSSNKEILELINEKIRIEMQSSTINKSDFDKRIFEINNKLDDLGAEIISPNEVYKMMIESATPKEKMAMVGFNTNNNTIISNNGTIITNGSANPPMPPSNDKIVFTSSRTKVNDVWVYSVIAAPIANTNHSCNTVSSYTNLKSKLFSLKSLVGIYVSKAIGKIKILGWLPYEYFTDLAFTSTNTSQLASYEAKLATRTVHQFIYLKNSADQWVYYGSANCVHINEEEIARRYVGSELKTQVKNTYKLQVADHYYDWPSYCTIDNLTGYGVVKKYSFVKGVEVCVDGNTAIRTDVVNALYPIQVAS